MISLPLRPTEALEGALEFEQAVGSREFDLRLRTKWPTGETLHGFRFCPNDYQENDAGLLAIADSFIRSQQLLKGDLVSRTDRAPLRFNEHSVGLSDFRILMRPYGSQGALGIEAYCRVERGVYVRLYGSCTPKAASGFGAEIRDIVLAARPPENGEPDS